MADATGRVPSLASGAVLGHDACRPLRPQPTPRPGGRSKTAPTPTCSSPTSAWSSGVDARLPIYSGGLGVLAGDHLKAAAELGLPLVGVGLLYRGGYFTPGARRRRAGRPRPTTAIDPVALGLAREPVTVEVELGGRDGRRPRSGATTSARCRSTCSTSTCSRTRSTAATASTGSARSCSSASAASARSHALGLEPTRLPRERGSLRHSSRSSARGRSSSAACRAGTRSSTSGATHGVHDAHAGPGGQRGLRRRARAPLRRRASPSRPGSRATSCSALGRADGTDGFGLTPLALRLSAHANARLRAARRGRARDVGGALAGLEPHRSVTSRTASTSARGSLRSSPRASRAVGVRPEAPPADGGWEAARELDLEALWHVRAALRERLAGLTGARPVAADDRLRPALRHVQARRPRLQRPRAAARAARADRRRRARRTRRTRPGKDAHAGDRRAVARPGSPAASCSSRATTSTSRGDHPRLRRLAEHAAAGRYEASGTSGMKAAVNGVPQPLGARRLVGGGLRPVGRLGDRGRSRTRRTPAELYRLLADRSCRASPRGTTGPR